MTKVKFLLSVVSILCISSSCRQHPPAEEWFVKAMERVQIQAEAMLPSVLESGRLPRSSQRGLCPPEDWTAGFYPGVLWYVYEYTEEDHWKQKAGQVTRMLEEQQHRTIDHDIGFVIYCSYGNGFRLTGDEAYEKVIIQAAETLSGMYSEVTRTIRSWPANTLRDWKYPVIIDNMMNLELLMAAYRMTGDKKFETIALAHADRTAECQYRADFSCSHVADYDPVTGEFRKQDWNNGNDDPLTSVWSRGQAWGLYGYTMMYRESSLPRYLEQAENIAEFILSHPNMPDDMVPYWDLSAPGKSTVRDSSAAAIMASALIELSSYSVDGAKYFAAGEKILKNLSSDHYLARPGTNSNFILKHATGNCIRNSETDGGLSYADYYFTEGLIRYSDLKNRM